MTPIDFLLFGGPLMILGSAITCYFVVGLVEKFENKHMSQKNSPRSPL